MSKWTAEQITDQRGRVFVITGANSGLGYETALALARHNATVVMACRDLERANHAWARLMAEVPTASADVMQLDLADLQSVRHFATQFKDLYPRLDVLINNAGVMAIPRRETRSGFEMHLGINHMGHFALTGLLMSHLLNTPGSRVVTVSSGMHTRGKIRWHDLNWENEYSRWDAYAQSKLANLLFAFELQRRLQKAGAQTISVGAHPGYAATNLQNIDDSAVMNALLSVTNSIFAQSAEKGALPLLYAAVAPDVIGCDYIGPDFLGMRGYPTKVMASEQAYREDDAERLWQLSTDQTGVRYTVLEGAAV